MMRTVAVLLALMVGPALGASDMVLTAPVRPAPASFVHPAEIPFTVKYLPAKDFANLKCPSSAELIRGCTVRGKRTGGGYIAWVFIRNDLCPGKKPDSCKLSAKVLAHEMGHVNGWPSHHPR